MKINRLKISRWIRNLRWDHRNLYHAFTTLVVMVCIVYVAFLFFGPMVLSGFFETGWFMLLEFIAIPTIVGTIGWVCDCFDY